MVDKKQDKHHSKLQYKIVKKTPPPQEQEQPVAYGEQAIATLEIELWDNPHPDLYLIEKQSFPEFTCKCPRSGYPDFATVYIEMVPDQYVIEMKCLKLYLNSYRDEYISHEAIVGKVFKDIISWIHPRKLRVVFDFTPRGNLHTIIELDSSKQQNCNSAIK